MSEPSDKLPSLVTERACRVILLVSTAKWATADLLFPFSSVAEILTVSGVVSVKAILTRPCASVCCCAEDREFATPNTTVDLSALKLTLTPATGAPELSFTTATALFADTPLAGLLSVVTLRLSITLLSAVETKCPVVEALFPPTVVVNETEAAVCDVNWTDACPWALVAVSL
ncbi:hypothetical protein D3C76_1072040 [compost metagenome]